jgi:cytochrome c5
MSRAYTEDMIQRVLMAAAIAGYSIGIVVGGAGANQDDQRRSSTPPTGARGKTLFESKCSGCHEPSRFMGDTFYEAWTASR